MTAVIKRVIQRGGGGGKTNQNLCRGLNMGAASSGRSRLLTCPSREPILLLELCKPSLLGF